MKPSLPLAGLVVVAAISSVSCDKFRPPQPELQAQKPPASSAAPAQPEDRKAFSESAQKELDQLKAAIADFKAKAENSGAEAKARLGEEIMKLEADARDAQDRLADLKAATAESWAKVKASFTASMDRLKSRLESFRKNTG
ncbi:MAG: hypothetical protein ACWA6Y_07720 [Polaromonas sp.]